MANVVVVGAGISGLATAYYIMMRAPEFKQSLSLTVLERETQLGGTIRSEARDGFHLEWGASALLATAPLTMSLLQRLGLHSHQRAASSVARRNFILHNSRLEALPESARALLKTPLLSGLGRARLATEPFTRGAPANRDESVLEFLTRRLGDEAGELIADALTTGLFAGDPSQLSASAALPFLKRLEHEHGSLLKGLIDHQQNARGPKQTSTTSDFISFDTGLQALPLALGLELQDRLRSGSAVQSLRFKGPRPGSPYLVTLASQETLEADAIVLTTPALVSARLMQPFDPACAGHLEQIPAVPVVALHLGFHQAQVSHPLDGFGLVVPRATGLKTLGGVFCSSLFPQHAPSGQVLIRLLLGGARDPQATALSDGALLSQALGELRAPLGLRGDPTFSAIQRIPQAIPQYTLGHPDRLRKLEARLSLNPGLFLGGNSYYGVGINDSIRQAHHNAEQVITYLKNHSS